MCPMLILLSFKVLNCEIITNTICIVRDMKIQTCDSTTTVKKTR